MYEPPPHAQRILVKHFRELEDQKHKASRKHWSQNFIDFENNKFLSRTPLSWLKILVFYVIFYCVLICYSCSVFLVFERGLNVSMPDVLIEHPGLSFAPALDPYHIEQTIKYRIDNQKEVTRYKKGIDDFLGKYVQNASAYFNQCNEDGYWGYSDGSPCVFIKVNRILGWKTDTKASDETTLDLPLELKHYIDSLPKSARNERLWIKCYVKENLPITFYYFDGPFIQMSYIEYEEKKYYTEYANAGGPVKDLDKYFFSKTDIRRIVAVKIMNMPRNTWGSVRCNAFAANLKYEKKKEAEDMISFKLHIA